MFVGRAVHGNRGYRQRILLRSFLQRHNRRSLWADTSGCGLHVGAGRTGFDRWWRRNDHHDHHDHHYNNAPYEYNDDNVDAYNNHDNVEYSDDNADAYNNHDNVDYSDDHDNVDVYNNHDNVDYSDNVRPHGSSGSIGERKSRQGRRRQLG